MAKPNSRAPLGQGGRFAALQADLAQRKGVSNPAALSAYIGRKKYGSGHFAALAAKGKKKKGKRAPKGDNPADSPAVEAAERRAGKAT